MAGGGTIGVSLPFDDLVQGTALGADRFLERLRQMTGAAADFAPHTGKGGKYRENSIY